MRIETVNYEVYTIKELSKEAQEKAFNTWLSDGYYPYSDENRATLEAFQKVFPVVARDWEYGYRNYIRFEMTCDDDVEELSGHRLATYIWNNYKDDIFQGKYYSSYKGSKWTSRRSKIKLISDCPLTGYYLDNTILWELIKFLDKPDKRNFRQLMKDCLEEWISGCDDDYNNYYSMETFIEECECNEWEFLEDGGMF